MKKIILYISVLAITFSFACSQETEESTPRMVSTPVQVMKAYKQKKSEKFDLIGNVGIEQEMKVAFKTSGKIIELTFEEGQKIKKNDLLARLDTKGLEAQKEKILENQAMAKRDLARMENLYDRNITPKSSLEDARTAYNITVADLKIIEDSLENSIIRAPFSGMIIKKLVEKGEVVGAGTPIALLAEMDPILVKASIPDHLIQKVSVGDSAIIRADWAPDDSFSGRIIRMESMADPVTRTLNIEILVPNPRNILKPGLITRVEITSERKESNIFLPINSVIGFGKSPYVFVVRSGHAQKQEVETGEIIREEVEIVEGITSGDSIIISGQEYVRDGQPVSIKEKGELDI